MSNKLLFATDFSDSSINAFEYVKGLIKKYPLQVDLMHVYDIPVPTSTTLATNAILGMIKERKEAVTRHLKDLRDELPEKSQGKIYAVHGTYPSTEISEKADAIGALLIVVAMRQKYSFFERLIGTTTAHTIQKANTPVLAIPNGVSFTNLTSVLFPTNIKLGEDLNKREVKAMKWLNEFIGIIENPDIHVLHISDDPNKVTTTVKDKPFKGMEFTVTGADSIPEGISEFLKNHSMNLLAFYKPNRSFWERLYHSSVTRKLLFKSRIPLLVFS